MPCRFMLGFMRYLIVLMYDSCRTILSDGIHRFALQDHVLRVAARCSVDKPGTSYSPNDHVLRVAACCSVDKPGTSYSPNSHARTVSGDRPADRVGEQMKVWTFLKSLHFVQRSHDLLSGFSPRANYTDRATAACRRS
jgi:hypothetical protein